MTVKNLEIFTTFAASVMLASEEAELICASWWLDKWLQKRGVDVLLRPSTDKRNYETLGAALSQSLSTLEMLSDRSAQIKNQLENLPESEKQKLVEYLSGKASSPSEAPMGDFFQKRPSQPNEKSQPKRRQSGVTSRKKH